MKTDTIFYSLFQAFPSIFFELIDRAPEEAANYEFTSREVKQLAFRLDGLFLPAIETPDKPFYIVEVQFQPNEELYYRLFAELFLYLRQYKPPHPWRVVVIYPTRSVEIEQTLHFGEFFNLNSVTRIYLDELGSAADASMGVKAVKLVTEPEETAGELARSLVDRAQQQLADEANQRNFINLVETILVYKLPNKSRKEIAIMLGLSELRNTRYFQEVFEEGKQEGIEEGKKEAKQKAIPGLVALGLSIEQIAQALDLSLDSVREKVKFVRRQKLSLSALKIDIFIELLTEQRSLFSSEDLTEVEQLVAPFPDDIGILATAISSWLENRTTIEEAQRQCLEPFTSPSSDVKSEIQLASEQPNKQALQNAIALDSPNP
ncbi:MAG: Rpn family recombination-promoting nuclease/putative transposase [Cyanobacteriota bacterium]|nr:Rpn family recombination-promoting nuclease/putative transposase [Cyanobacteriota bacterium]